MSKGAIYNDFVPSYQRFTSSGIVSLYYEESGSGHPVLLIAPGGMRSTISAWENAPWHPVKQLSEKFRVIAMDQRNAGRSTGPITVDDGWETYRQDQLALMNHLGIGRFHVVGMCIGGSYIGSLLETAPHRVTAAVVMQTIGLSDNRQAFFDMFDRWADDLKPKRPDVADEAWPALRHKMYGSDRPFFSVEPSVFGGDTPILALQGDDLYHPTASSRLLTESASNATLIEKWKDDPARKVAMGKVHSFLVEHVPSTSNGAAPADQTAADTPADQQSPESPVDTDIDTTQG